MLVHMRQVTIANRMIRFSSYDNSTTNQRHRYPTIP